MEPRIYVKVIGFRDVERHALKTLFRLSRGRPASYGLWTPEAPVEPHLVLMDLEAYEAGLNLASQGLNPNQKMICVGQGAPANAWRAFERPLHWPDIVQAMDSLFAPAHTADEGVDFDLSDAKLGVPSGFKVSLLVDPTREDRMYLRARLALAGFPVVDEAQTGALALDLAKKRHYDLVIVGLGIPDMDGWALIRQMVTLEPAIGSVVVTTTDKSWHVREHAEQCGCRGLLEKPYDPSQVVKMLQNI